ncbi:hypothetical protein BT96DRAFT_1000734 [Gymnopus androsaceus JB14]|uniref:HNH nuclease domain-containing protein n=1 Tax=Gymnopus androsaceus JB14 TaxID=1447944 RepID=A0A6A4H3T2_9AGAR|nr:hypothetical protein BT96DRAFT_1000734 [Gymnopus androsaceus JB14]
MSSSFPIISLTTTAVVEKLEPVKDFCLFQQIISFCAREYWWGLKPGDIDIDSHLNRISVRGDIERLLSRNVLTLVPTKQVIDTMQELTLYNRKHFVSERQRCFDVLPDQPYQYRLVPGSQMKKPIPLFAFDSSSGTFQRFDHPYDNLPLFTLGCYPFHSIMHSDFALSRSRPIHETSLGIFNLSLDWASDYPHVGSFVNSPCIAAIIAAYAAADNGNDPYLDLDGTSGEDDDTVSNSESESDVSVSFEEPKNTGVFSVSLSKRAAKHIASWRETLEPAAPVVVSALNGGSIRVSESRTPVNID